MTSSYYRNSDAAILVYSIDNEESFDSLHRWTKQLDKCGKDGLVKIIVGNKSDLEDERSVSTQSAVEFALADDAAAVVECSAKENDNIELLFEALARKLISMTSEHCGSYCEDPKGKVMTYQGSDPAVERLINNFNQEKKVAKKKLFNLPELSSGCFRKLCGIC